MERSSGLCAGGGAARAGAGERKAGQTDGIVWASLPPPPRPLQTRLLKAITGMASTLIRIKANVDLESAEEVGPLPLPATVSRSWHVT